MATWADTYVSPDGATVAVTGGMSVEQQQYFDRLQRGTGRSTSALPSNLGGLALTPDGTLVPYAQIPHPPYPADNPGVKLQFFVINQDGFAGSRFPVIAGAVAAIMNTDKPETQQSTLDALEAQTARDNASDLTARLTTPPLPMSPSFVTPASLVSPIPVSQAARQPVTIAPVYTQGAVLTEAFLPAQNMAANNPPQQLTAEQAPSVLAADATRTEAVAAAKAVADDKRNVMIGVGILLAVVGLAALSTKAQ